MTIRYAAVLSCDARGCHRRLVSHSACLAGARRLGWDIGLGLDDGPTKDYCPRHERPMIEERARAAATPGRGLPGVSGPGVHGHLDTDAGAPQDHEARGNGWSGGPSGRQQPSKV